METFLAVLKNFIGHLSNTTYPFLIFRRHFFESTRPFTMTSLAKSPDLEIVGLYASGNGRTCFQHKICGEYVKEDDLLRLVKCVVEVKKDQVEEAVKLVKIADGAESCTVAFVPRVFANDPKVIRNIGKYVQVIELYQDSDNTHKRRLSGQNYGMASVVFLDDIPINE